MKKHTLLLATLGAMVLLSGCGSQETHATATQPSAQTSTALTTSAQDSQGTAYDYTVVSLAEAVDDPYGAVFEGTTSYVINRPQEEDQDYILYALDEDGQVLRTYTVPNEDSGIVDMAPEADGALWVVTSLWEDQDFAGSQLLHYTASGVMDKQLSLDWLDETPQGLTLDEENQCLYLLDINTLYVVETDGSLRFSLMGTASLGSMALTDTGALWVIDQVDGSSMVRVLDLENQTWGKTFTDMPYGILYGTSSGQVYGRDTQTLYTVDTQSGQATAVLDLINTGFYGAVQAVCSLEDGELLLWSRSETVDQLCCLSPSDGQGRIVLTLATMEYNWYDGTVLTFNESQDEYKIEIRYYEDSVDGLNQMNLDIISGDAPDIYALRNMPISQMVSQGLLEDIYPFIDADPDMDIADFNPTLLAAMETDGKLYTLIPHVSIYTLMSVPGTLGEESVTFGELLSLADGEDPFGGDMTSYQFLQYTLAGQNSPFVDWSSGTCDFQNQEFYDALALARLLPTDYDGTGTFTNRSLALSTGASGTDLIYDGIAVGCEPNQVPELHGLPGRDGQEQYLLTPSTNIYGISAQSDHQDGIWEFLRTYLLEEYQEGNSIPLLRSQEEKDKASTAQWVAEYGEYEMPSPTEGWITFTVPDTRYEDAFWELLDKANGVYEANPSLMEIIWSEAQAYFAGDKTAEQAAENIQSRVSLYLAE
jgi:ABC-type glycerol-3-phosphate transport system substrate-binding protein/uncharacterized protein YceK